MKNKRANAISLEIISNKIFLIRDKKVMLDSDLAALYGVETRILVQAVKRNLDRFPGDFMYQLTSKEVRNLRSQIVISSWGGRRYSPYVFTEHGVAMLSSILHSERAIQVNIAIMRAFVAMRHVVKLSGKRKNDLLPMLKDIRHETDILNEDVEDIFISIDQLDQRIGKVERKVNAPKLEDYLK